MYGSSEESRPWDFSHVHSLINTLSATYSDDDCGASTPDALSNAAGSPLDDTLHGKDIDTRDFAHSPAGLGDFTKIFQFLGTSHSPGDVKSNCQEVQVPTRRLPLASLDQYASDGATYIKPGSTRNHELRFDDPTSTEDTLTDRVSDDAIVVGISVPSKKQLKKLRQKERRQQQQQQQQQNKKSLVRPAAATLVYESEAEIFTPIPPARKASAHITQTSAIRPRNRERSGHNVSRLPANNEKAHYVFDTGDMHRTSNSSSQPAPVMNSGKVKPKTYSVQQNLQTPMRQSQIQNHNLQTQLFRQFQTPSTNRFLPSSMPPRPATSRVAPVPATGQPVYGIQSWSSSNLPDSFKPIVVRPVEDRNWTLLMKLISNFWNDRKYLISPMNLTTHNNDPHGIHVFVDASNIFIGFNEQLKRSQGIPLHVRLPDVGLSFDAIALLMERRRPIAKRVLAGSTPYIPAFGKAKDVGYECSILEKVYKARELTERQIYFKNLDEKSRSVKKAPPANRVATANGYGNSQGESGSGSETNAPQFAPARMIEQCVDEILHLKILESIVDVKEPSTMVLATGDAAQAEYSDGFMAMAERALKKGWTVELVSWSHLISQMYKRKAWKDAWGDRFKIIFLDDYVEELLDL